MKKQHFLRSFGILVAVSCTVVEAIGAAPAPMSVCSRVNAARETVHDADDIAIIGIDAQSEEACLVDGSRRRKVENGTKVRLKSSTPLRVFVFNTNTAIYAHGLEGEAVEAEELGRLKLFANALGGYLIEAGRALTPPPAFGVFAQMEVAPTQGKETSSELLDALEAALKAVEDDLYGPNGLQQTGSRIVASLEKMRGKTGDGLESLRAELERQIVGEHKPFRREKGDGFEFRLATLQFLTKHLETLASSLAAIPNRSEEDCGHPCKRAREVLAQSPKVLEAAYAVEAWGDLALRASDVWWSEEVGVSLAEGRKITVTVAPRERAEIDRLTASDGFSFEASILPDWALRPSVGLSLLYAREAAFPKFGTKPLEEGVEIIPAGIEDRRFTYGLTLGFTPRFLDFRGRSGIAIWPIELTVNPSDDVRAIALGGAISWKLVKVGVGGLWTKYTRLDGQAPGDNLTSADELRTKEGYGKVKLYVSVSIFDWPPFKYE